MTPLEIAISGSFIMWISIGVGYLVGWRAAWKEIENRWEIEDIRDSY